MPAIFATAPGKVILFGEHAVVYGRPAIAIPISDVQAKAVITPDPLSMTGIVTIDAPDIQVKARLAELPENNPLRRAVAVTLDEIHIEKPPALTIRVSSTIPLASGMGSGAAISVAMIRALAMYLGRSLPDARVSDLAFEVEKIYHGTPSGIDNTVIAFGKPVYFEGEQPIQFLKVSYPFKIVIADSGVQSSTAAVVADVRRLWNSDHDRIELLFDGIRSICEQGKLALKAGNLQIVGNLMNRNHALLRELTVSSEKLDYLVDTALNAGAIGAKLSGGGRGGNVIALVGNGDEDVIAEHLRVAGAIRTIVTRVFQKV